MGGVLISGTKKCLNGSHWLSWDSNHLCVKRKAEVLMRSQSLGERAGALQGGSVRYGLQARQRTCRPGTAWFRGGGGKTLEKTRQQQQEGESTTSYQAPGSLTQI